MKITIAHLYPKELDLYGENGNIKALKYALENNNIEVTIKNINKEDNPNFNEFDFVYIGSGRKIFLEKVKERLKPYKNDILKYISNNKIFLVTGNALSIFEFLGLYEVLLCSERKVADVVATTSLCNENVYGFQNTEYLLKSTEGIIFNIIKGHGNNNIFMEGYNVNNFYVTSLIGPILARNDNLTNYFVDLIIEDNKESLWKK